MELKKMSVLEAKEYFDLHGFNFPLLIFYIFQYSLYKPTAEKNFYLCVNILMG